MSRGLASGMVSARSVRLLALAAACLGALALAPIASAGSERVADVERQRASGAGCGPCPSVVFAKGSGSGWIEAWTVWKDSPPTEERCDLPARSRCIFYIDEGFLATGAYLRARTNVPGVTFVGWEGEGCIRQSGTDCHISPGSIVSVCAVFRAGSETVTGPCPPPSVQLYKKGDGSGTVTISGSGGGSETCNATCPSSVTTRWATGETITLTAAAAVGSSFARWDDCPAVQPDGTCRFVLGSSSPTICSVFVKTGSSAPDTLACPYLTPPIVKPPAPPTPRPPKLGSRCTIPGSNLGETIRAGGQNDVVCARGGNDRLDGRGGHDLLLGGSGHDRIWGGSGYDRLRGDAGNDKLYAGSGLDVAEGGGGNDVFYTRDGRRDTVRCGRGRDVVYADRADRVPRDCEVVRRTRR